jgi:hypothetical protein
MNIKPFYARQATAYKKELSRFREKTESKLVSILTTNNENKCTIMRKITS